MSIPGMGRSGSKIQTSYIIEQVPDGMFIPIASKVAVKLNLAT